LRQPALYRIVRTGEKNVTLREMLTKIGMVRPYQGFDASKPLDLQGWNSEHPYFASLITMTKPKQIIEVGTWKGASAVNMARQAMATNRGVTVLCVDTWLGSNELWTVPEWRKMLRQEHGYPTVYRQFLANIIHSGLTETIFPLPMTSISAAELLAKFAIQVDLVYIDGAHGEYEVYGDLVHYWPLVRSGGAMFGDDYSMEWHGVIKAVNRFAYENALGLGVSDRKWFLVKRNGVRSSRRDRAQQSRCSKSIETKALALQAQRRRPGSSSK
jgi:predicted O-methyltransferase YrrM